MKWAPNAAARRKSATTGLTVSRHAKSASSESVNAITASANAATKIAPREDDISGSAVKVRHRGQLATVPIQAAASRAIVVGFNAEGSRGMHLLSRVFRSPRRARTTLVSEAQPACRSAALLAADQLPGVAAEAQGEVACAALELSHICDLLVMTLRHQAGQLDQLRVARFLALGEQDLHRVTGCTVDREAHRLLGHRGDARMRLTHDGGGGLGVLRRC